MNTKIISTIIKIVILSGISVLSLYLLQTNQSSEDSGAIYGGELEKGYPSAGYLISESLDDYYNYCGIVNVGNNRVFTAAHCVDKTKGVTIGFGDFATTGNDELEINTVYRNTGWESQNVNEDFAVIEYSKDPDQYISTALVIAPEEGCEYFVVGYGRTGEEGDTANTIRPRKSARVCIERIEENIIYLTGDTGGICLGDSGSPIFKENSNQVVGVISSIITTPETELIPCYIGNSAIAVRVDQKLREFNDLAEDDSLETSGSYQALDFVEPVTSIDIEVEPESALEELQDRLLEERELITFLIFVVMSLAFSLLLVEVLKASRRSGH